MVENRIHKDDREAYKAAINKLIKNDTPLRTRVRLEDSRGGFQSFYSQARAERNVQGRVDRIFGVFTDTNLLTD